VRQPFVDIHDYQRFPEFSAAGREIFCSNELMETISAVTGASRHNLMQTMLFDLNTATRPHQDWYDLDSVPNGSLIAACIALEDIREEPDASMSCGSTAISRSTRRSITWFTP